MTIGGHGGGSRGGRPPLEPKIEGLPPGKKTAPPPPGGLGPPKRFGDFGAEARPKLCSSYFLSTFYLILSKVAKNLRLAPHFIIYPYVIININICSRKIPLLRPPPRPPLGWKIAPPPRGKMRSSPSPEKKFHAHVWTLPSYGQVNVVDVPHWFLCTTFSHWLSGSVRKHNNM